MSKFEVLGFDISHIRNRNETRVLDVMRQLLPGSDQFCGCRVCVEDVYAAVMNYIQPQYAQPTSIVLQKEPVMAEIEQQVRTACARVGRHPKHKPVPIQTEGC